MDLTAVPSTDPLEIYRYRDGLYAADLVIAAVCEFDLFTWLAARPPVDAATICRELGLKERPVDVMLTLFVANGFLRRRGELVEVTELAREHLVRTSPFFLGPYYASLQDRPVARDFATILRTGRTAKWGSFGAQEWSRGMLTEEFATTFTAAMDCRGFYFAPAVARGVDTRGRRRLLDIAGGSGIYACAFVAQHPHLSATVFERPPVDEIARTMIAKRGFAERVGVESGDMFATPLPRGCDLHLFSNVLHDWDVEKVRPLLAASFAALEPGGLVIVHGAHVNADKTGPLAVAKYSALLMSVTEGKCYSTAELEALLGAAGFREFRHEPTVADRSVITAVKPR